MLYDNALVSLKGSKEAIRAGDKGRQEILVERSKQIVTALVGCLDTQNGEMAVDLRTLYCYVLNELSQANTDTTTSRIERCEVVMKDLRKVWLELEASILPMGGRGSIAA
jgi:flagellar protein FliS